MKDGLDEWRKEIRAIDSEIISLASRRMELALKIGRYKAEHQLPVKDFRVEKEIVERTRVMAEGLGLAPDFAEDLMTLIMGHSVKEQNKLHQSKRKGPSITLKEVLIVGGLGRMGRWFAQYFQSIGFQVSIYDTKEESLPETFTRHLSLEDDLDRYELIFLTTPIMATSQILRTLAEKQPKGMVIESSSLKTPVREGIQKLCEKGVKVASIHPMFGPDTDLLLDKNILLCTGGDLASREAASLYFHSTSADLVEVDIDQHDRDMLSTLGLVHFINLVFGITLAETELPLAKAQSLGGSSFHEQIRTTSGLFSENHELYFDIQAQNPHSLELYTGLHSAFARLKTSVETNDKAAFLKEIAKASRYFN